MKKFQFFVLGIFLSVIACVSIAIAQPHPEPALWQIYQQSLKSAKYVDLTHTITPSMPVWAGFGSPQFSATVN